MVCQIEVGKVPAEINCHSCEKTVVVITEAENAIPGSVMRPNCSCFHLCIRKNGGGQSRTYLYEEQCGGTKLILIVRGVSNLDDEDVDLTF